LHEDSRLIRKGANRSAPCTAKIDQMARRRICPGGAGRIARRISAGIQGVERRLAARHPKRSGQKEKSARLQRAVVIAMTIMRVMQSSVYEVIDVVAVGHGFVSAARPMRMRAPGLGRAACRVRGADLDDMEVDVVPMHVVQAAIVQIVDMAVVAHSGVPAARTMLMCMIGMMRFGAGGRRVAHLSSLLSG
jgi:hypothetical protein